MKVDDARMHITVRPGFLIIKHFKVKRTLAVKPYDWLRGVRFR
jgi:hypothetical protein